MITGRVLCRKFTWKLPLWIKFTTNIVALMRRKSSSLPAFKETISGKYRSLVQQPESFLKWLTDAKTVAMKWCYASPQRRMMKELLAYPDKLNIHIKNLDDEIVELIIITSSTGNVKLTHT